MLKRLVLFFALFLLFSPLAGQPTEQTLELLQTNITQKLQELRTQLTVMERELTLLQQTSLKEREALEQQLQTLKISYNNTFQQLTSSYSTIDAYKNMLEQKNTSLQNLIKFTATLIIVLILSIILKIALYIVAAKGVRLPRWLEILI